jgi:hypothetical protein
MDQPSSRSCGTMAGKLQIYADKHNREWMRIDTNDCLLFAFIRVHSWLIPLFGVSFSRCVRRCRRLRYADIGCIEVRVIAGVGGDHEI